MKQRFLLCIITCFVLTAVGHAQIVERSILPTVTEEGEWPCKYYFLNYNTDIVVAERKKWAALEEDESYWIDGVGPFSNDQNMFYITEWPSQLRPILVRRHFTLTADDIEEINRGTLTFTCSYDEDPKAYLNGTRIWSATGWNDNSYATSNLTARSKGLLVEGDNVLAVSLKQGGGGGHLDYGLRLKVDNTGIEEVQGKAVADSEIFTLAGVKLVSATYLPKGIYIENNKKVIIK